MGNILCSTTIPCKLTILTAIVWEAGNGKIGNIEVAAYYDNMQQAGGDKENLTLGNTVVLK